MDKSITQAGVNDATMQKNRTIQKNGRKFIALVSDNANQPEFLNI
jgi:hypothetical protein